MPKTATADPEDVTADEAAAEALEQMEPEPWHFPDRVYEKPIPLDNEIFQPMQLAIDVSEMTFDEYAEIGYPLDVIAEGHQWWGGDWYNMGAEKFGREELYQILDEMKSKTFENYGYTCGRIPPELRDPALVFTHYKYIADLRSIPSRKKAIRLAIEGDWTTEETRLYVQQQNGVTKEDDEGGDEDDGEVTSVSFTYGFNVNPGDEKAGQQAAKIATEAGERALADLGVVPNAIHQPNVTYNKTS